MIATQLPLGDKTIAKMAVHGLFGQYDYHISLIGNNGSSQLLILYGPNGCGKSTILQLTYHLLNPEPQKGHRSYLVNVVFSSFAIHFVDGTRVSATRSMATTGPYLFSITWADGTTYEKLFEPDETGSIPRSTTPEELQQDVAFNEMLSAIDLDLHWLPEDRKALRTTNPRQTRLFEPDFWIQTRTREHLLSLGDDPDVSSVVKANRRLTRSLQRRTFAASNIGTANVNQLYAQIVRDLGRPLPQVEDSAFDVIRARLSQLAEQSDDFAKVGLISSDGMRELMEALSQANTSQPMTVVRVLEPFLKSVETRLAALDAVHNTIALLLDVFASFYRDKTVSFNVESGLRVQTKAQDTLELQSLSSGEQQLMLLMCEVATAQERQSLFIIDEPELSLNIRWQRDLISSLLKFGADSSLQFLIATHSLEILSKYRDNVISLDED